MRTNSATSLSLPRFGRVDVFADVLRTARGSPTGVVEIEKWRKSIMSEGTWTVEDGI